MFNSITAMNDNIAISYYDLLLVMPDNDTSYDNKMAGIAHRPISKHSSFSYHAYSNADFNNLLKNGDPFINKICRQALLLHNSGTHSIHEGDIPCLNPAFANTAYVHWVRGINQARQLYRMAERAAHRNEREQALSQLEQAACEACRTLITLYTGHRQRAQILSQLLKYCDNFCPLRTRVFPCNTREETELLQWLERTVFIENTRYQYHVPPYILDTLLRRINKLLDLADWLYTQTVLNSNKSLTP